MAIGFDGELCIVPGEQTSDPEPRTLEVNARECPMHEWQALNAPGRVRFEG
jgi:hypothetical protein